MQFRPYLLIWNMFLTTRKEWNEPTMSQPRNDLSAWIKRLKTNWINQCNVVTLHLIKSSKWTSSLYLDVDPPQESKQIRRWWRTFSMHSSIKLTELISWYYFLSLLMTFKAMMLPLKLLLLHRHRRSSSTTGTILYQSRLHFYLHMVAQMV